MHYLDTFAKEDHFPFQRSNESGCQKSKNCFARTVWSSLGSELWVTVAVNLNYGAVIFARTFAPRCSTLSSTFSAPNQPLHASHESKTKARILRTLIGVLKLLLKGEKGSNLSGRLLLVATLSRVWTGGPSAAPKHCTNFNCSWYLVHDAGETVSNTRFCCQKATGTCSSVFCMQQNRSSVSVIHHDHEDRGVATVLWQKSMRWSQCLAFFLLLHLVRLPEVSSSCSFECRNGGSCDTVTNKCFCEQFYEGEDCSLRWRNIYKEWFIAFQVSRAVMILIFTITLFEAAVLLYFYAVSVRNQRTSDQVSLLLPSIASDFAQLNNFSALCAVHFSSDTSFHWRTHQQPKFSSSVGILSLLLLCSQGSLLCNRSGRWSRNSIQRCRKFHVASSKSDNFRHGCVDIDLLVVFSRATCCFSDVKTGFSWHQARECRN